MAAKDIRRIVVDVAMFAASQVALYYTVQYVMSRIDVSGPGGERAKASKKSAAILARLNKEGLELSEYEEVIAGEVIHPDDISVNFKDIGGLEPIVSSLRETILYPLTHPGLFSTSNLLSAPKGVLLYGPPGCGKSMLAKALAKESNATFINISLSTLANKWYGESNKLVHALFSLARKMQPAIIFIDEIDSFLSERGRGDHEVTSTMKASFMIEWDGLTTGPNTRILVLGATNRPNDIDQAILRRMPKRFAVRLPNEEQREKILGLMLKNTSLAPPLTITQLAKQTDGMSGSDLQELCRNAAMVPVREYMRSEEGMKKGSAEGFKLRPLTHSDFFDHRDDGTQAAVRRIEDEIDELVDAAAAASR